MNSKKRALGRGLDAILQSPETDITSNDISGEFVVGAIASIYIGSISANPFQPRDSFEEESLRELSESIAEQGIIQPVTVRKMGYDKYQLISGERRLRAAMMAGLNTVPAYIRVANDQQMLEMALVENIQRQELNPLAIAMSFNRLLEECNLTQEQLSDKVGKKRSTVANYLRLLKLPARIQIALRDNTITMGHARALLGIEDEKTQLIFFGQIIARELSVRQVEKMVQAFNQPPTAEHRPVKQELPLPLQELRQSISQHMGSDIEMQRNTNGKGKIVISFSNDKELERIARILLHQT